VGCYAAVLESFWGGTARGDQLARMALAAIRETGAAPTSLHASFLAEAAPDEVAIRCDAPVAAQRRVRLEQRGAPVCEAVFRFDPPSGELTYQSRPGDRDLPEPESLPAEAELGAREGWARYAVGPIESRRVGAPAPVQPHEEAI
jgi:acyl-CoA thioesterase